MSERKTYVTTASAGFVVAGHRIPAVYEDGKPARPTVGFDLRLTDAEAEYELAQGTIVPAEPRAKKTARQDAPEAA